MEKRINVWLPEQTLKDLNARGQTSDATREALGRYFAMLSYERQQLRQNFTGGELSLLADICNGTAFTGGLIPLGLLADAEDAEQTYYEKWHVEREELLGKLRMLTTIQEATLVDAIERFWAAAIHVSTLTLNPARLLD